MKTKEQLMSWFGCNEDMANMLVGLYDAGLRHGREGWYPDGDFSSYADWCYGTGQHIQWLEGKLEVYDNDVFDIYCEGHSQGLSEFSSDKGERR